MNYIFLAAAAGRSMQVYGPKVLLPYGRGKLIDSQINVIKRFDKEARIYYVVGFQKKKILEHVFQKRYDCSILVNELYKTSGQSESLRIGLNAAFKQDTYIIHGDIGFNQHALNVNKTPTVTISNCKNDSGVGVLHDGERMLNMSFGLDDQWGQIFFLPAEEFMVAKQEINKMRVNRLTYEFVNMLSERMTFSVNKSSRISIKELSR
jgi:CTP:phosphocholine cytidylyltransferase-like protein